MRFLRSLAEAQNELKDSVVTMGNFDGVHLGHRQLMEELKFQAQKLNSKSVVLTFNPHPLEVLQPHREFQRLFPVEDQMVQMEIAGVDYFIQHPFTLEFSKLTPEDFLKKHLFPCLHPKALVVGYDFAFGSGRQGTLPRLQEVSAQLGASVILIPPYERQGHIVSSSKIREFVRRGEMRAAQDFLGRPFYLKGIVIRGDQRGRTIGFPTANLDVKWNLKPRVGVYATQTLSQGRMFRSMTNVGWNPTVSERRDQLKIETHLFDFDEEIYGEELQVEFVQFLREEKKFSSMAELKTQLDLDRKTAKDYFNVHAPVR